MPGRQRSDQWIKWGAEIRARLDLFLMISEKAEVAGRHPDRLRNCLTRWGELKVSDVEECTIKSILQNHSDGRTSSNVIVQALFADLRVHVIGIVEGDLRDCIPKFILFPTVFHICDSLSPYVAHYAILKETVDVGALD
jgi:hypothetical protein